MLTEEEFVEATALYRRGWSISAIARHLGQAEAAAALFEVVQRRYLKGSINPDRQTAASPAGARSSTTR